MPSEYSPSENPRDYAEFPRLVDDIGENPAKFLDRPDAIPFAVPLIRGIHTLERANAWLAVERRIDRGPRDRLVAALENRITDLEAHGERPTWDEITHEAARLRHEKHPEWRELDTPEIPERTSFRTSGGVLGRRSSGSSADRGDDTEESSLDAFAAATDGGEGR